MFPSYPDTPITRLNMQLGHSIFFLGFECSDLPETGPHPLSGLEPVAKPSGTNILAAQLKVLMEEETCFQTPLEPVHLKRTLSPACSIPPFSSLGPPSAEIFITHSWHSILPNWRGLAGPPSVMVSGPFTSLRRALGQPGHSQA